MASKRHLYQYESIAFSSATQFFIVLRRSNSSGLSTISAAFGSYTLQFVPKSSSKTGIIRSYCVGEVARQYTNRAHVFANFGFSQAHVQGPVHLAIPSFEVLKQLSSSGSFNIQRDSRVDTLSCYEDNPSSCNVHIKPTNDRQSRNRALRQFYVGASRFPRRKIPRPDRNRGKPDGRGAIRR